MKIVTHMIAAAALMIMMFVTGLQAQDNQGFMIVASSTLTATVTQINQKSRKVTIKASDGQKYSFVAYSGVKNLSQVKRGDTITVQYAESLTYQVRKHSNARLKTTDVAVVAAPGTKPVGVVAQHTMTVKVTAVDPGLSSITVSGQHTKTIKVNDPQQLHGIQVGDMVDVIYTDAVAIKVDEVNK